MLAWLQAEHENLTPEAKLFWLRMGRIYGVGTPVSLGIKELPAQLNLGERFVARAISDLGKIQGSPGKPGFRLIWRWTEASSRGRPAYYYMAAPWTAPSKTTSCKLGKGREELIERILFKVRRPAFKARGLSLSPTNCLLLALLVSLAGVCGEIRGVSRARLRAMMGMSYERLENQLLKLRRMGYLFGWIGGGTGKFILGVRYGVYWLNLKKCGEHFKVELDPPTEGRVSYIYADIGAILVAATETKDILPEEVCELDGSSQVIWSPVERSKRGLMLFFESESGARLSEILQEALEEAAAWIAGRILKVGPDYSPDSERDAFIDRYQTVFVPESVLRKLTVALETVVIELLEYLFDLCRKMASCIVSVVRDSCRSRDLLGSSMHIELVACDRTFPSERRFLISHLSCRDKPNEPVDE